jgi:transposase
MRAFELKEAGWKQRDIAEALGVSTGAVSRWLDCAAQGGRVALEARSRSGAPTKLSREALSLVPEFLSYGAEAYGFRGEVWTSRRVTKVIEWEYGVTYNHRYVASLLKRLNWTPQKPIERASQRDEAAIARWRIQAWEDLKKRLSPKIE